MAELKFPLFLDLTGKKVAVIGGGAIALRRVRTLLRFGADITVTAPEIDPALLALDGVDCRSRCYTAADVQGAFLVLAATDDPLRNRAITADARAAGILANNASDQTDSDFFFPAVAVQEEICVGVCGTGRDHHAVARTAAKIRRLLAGEAREE